MKPKTPFAAALVLALAGIAGAQDLASTYTIDSPGFQGAISLTRRADGGYDVVGMSSGQTWRGSAVLGSDGRTLVVTRVLTTTESPSVGTAGKLGNTLLGENNTPGAGSSQKTTETLQISLDGTMQAGTVQVYSSRPDDATPQVLGSGTVTTRPLAAANGVTIPDFLKNGIATTGIPKANDEVNSELSKVVSKIPVPAGDKLGVTVNTTLSPNLDSYTTTWAGTLNHPILPTVSIPIAIGGPVTLTATVGMSATNKVQGSITSPLPANLLGTDPAQVKALLDRLPVQATVGMINDPEKMDAGTKVTLSGNGSVATTGGLSVGLPIARLGRIGMGKKGSELLDFGPSLGFNAGLTISGNLALSVTRLADQKGSSAKLVQISVGVTGGQQLDGGATFKVGFTVPKSSLTDIENAVNALGPSASIVVNAEDSAVSGGLSKALQYAQVSVSFNASELTSAGVTDDVVVDVSNPKGLALYRSLVGGDLAALDRMSPADKAAAGVKSVVNTESLTRALASKFGIDLFSIFDVSVSNARGDNRTITTRQPVGAATNAATLDKRAFTASHEASFPFGFGKTSVGVTATEATLRDGSNTTSGAGVDIQASHTTEHNVTADDVKRAIYAVNSIMPEAHTDLMAFYPRDGRDYPQFDSTVGVSLGQGALDRITRATKEDFRGALGQVLGLSPQDPWLQRNGSYFDPIAAKLNKAAGQSAQAQLEAFRSAVPTDNWGIPVSLALAKLAGPDGAKVSVTFKGTDASGKAVAFDHTTGTGAKLPALGGD
ncbi:MAG TPA: hypothetical protein VFF73_05090 [Planctomycetota bacterium]|nr:hypothetical protein [Planctomycetota bacterium]